MSLKKRIRSEHDCIRISLVGDSVGKTCLIHRFVHKSFSSLRVKHASVQQLHHKQMSILKQTFDIQILDTITSHSHSTLHARHKVSDTPSPDTLKISSMPMPSSSNQHAEDIDDTDNPHHHLYIRRSWITDSHVLFILFNRLDRNSWHLAQQIHQCTLQHSTSVPTLIYVVSTCCDLYRTPKVQSDPTQLISYDEIQQYIQQFSHVYFFETSAKFNQNVSNAFKSAIAKYYELTMNSKPQPHAKTIKPTKTVPTRQLPSNNSNSKNQNHRNKNIHKNGNNSNNNNNNTRNSRWMNGHDDGHGNGSNKPSRSSKDDSYIDRSKHHHHQHQDEQPSNYTIQRENGMTISVNHAATATSMADGSQSAVSTPHRASIAITVSTPKHQPKAHYVMKKPSKHYRKHQQKKPPPKQGLTLNVSGSKPMRPQSARSASSNSVSTFGNEDMSFINDIDSSDEDDVAPDEMVIIHQDPKMIGVASPKHRPKQPKHAMASTDSSPSHGMTLPVAATTMDKAQSVPLAMSNGSYKDGGSKKQFDKQENIYSGHLWKCGKFVKSWKLRYFIFCGDYQLRYYTSAKLETLKGIADLSPANVVSVDIGRADDEHQTAPTITGYPFVITCKNRTWKFRASSLRDREQWIEMLTTVVLEAKKKSELQLQQTTATRPQHRKSSKTRSMIGRFLGGFSAPNSPRLGSNGDLRKQTRTLAEADEDAMDFFGLSSEQYLYTVHIYQAKNIPRSKIARTEPNVYVTVEFNQCKSGNRYQTSVIHNCIDPVFNASIIELAELDEIDNITLSVFHRRDGDADEEIGKIVIPVATFATWDRWLWMPIVHDPSTTTAAATTTTTPQQPQKTQRNGHDGVAAIASGTTSPPLFYDGIRAYTGMMQVKFECMSLDDALLLVQSKELHAYSHAIALHIHHFVAYDHHSQHTQHFNKDHVNKGIGNPPAIKFTYPLLQIQWKYDEIFSTRFAQKTRKKNGSVWDCYKWEESHYIYAQLLNEQKKSHLRFNILDDEIETGNDIIGEGKISWNQLKKIEQNQMQPLKIPIFARRVITPQSPSSARTAYLKNSNDSPINIDSVTVSVLSFDDAAGGGTHEQLQHRSNSNANAEVMKRKKSSTTIMDVLSDHEDDDDVDEKDQEDSDAYLSSQPIGHILIDIEISSKQRILRAFYRKLFTLHWIKKTHAVPSYSKRSYFQQQPQKQPPMQMTYSNPTPAVHRKNMKSATKSQMHKMQRSATTTLITDAYFTPNEVLLMLLSIGIHPSDNEFENWVHTLSLSSLNAADANSDEDDKRQMSRTDDDDDILQMQRMKISMDDVITLLMDHKFETSVSLTHYITAYLHFVNSKKFMKLPASSNSNSNSSTNRKQQQVVKNGSRTADSLIDAGWWVRFDRSPLLSADKDDFFVMDRKTRYRQREHVPGYLKIALKCMYDGWLARFSTDKAKQCLDVFGKDKACRFDETSSTSMIGNFVQLHHIDMRCYQPSDLQQYATFNEFFSRDIVVTPQMRASLQNATQSPTTQKTLLSPCSGKLICYAQFSECTQFWVKGSKFNVLRLLGDELYERLLSTSTYQNDADNERFRIQNLEQLKTENRVEYNRAMKAFSNKFAIAIARLSPSDYHGYHYPFDAKCVAISPIEGALYSVSPIVVNRDVNVLTENKRCCVLFENLDTFGYCCMIIVASFLVGSYSVNCEIGQHVKCGELMGKFKYGGSCVILLFNKSKIRFDDDLISNSMQRPYVETIVNLYDHIAVAAAPAM